MGLHSITSDDQEVDVILLVREVASEMVTPVVSVVMSVYNGERFIEQAVRSVLDQTFDDFEFLIIDDGSTDASSEIVSSFVDDRIRVVRNEANLNVPVSVNKGMRLARGVYVARMDSDDVCHPDRFERQVSFLDSHAHIGILGTWARTFGGDHDEVWRPPLRSDEMKAGLLFRSTVLNPTVMMRRELFLTGDLAYDESFVNGVEDWELWHRLKRRTEFANLPEVLLRYRTKPVSEGSWNQEGRLREAAGLIRRNLVELGIDATDEEVELHRLLGFGDFVKEDSSRVDDAERWLLRLINANRESGPYPAEAFAAAISEIWLRICYLSAGSVYSKAGRYFRSPLRSLAPSLVVTALTELIRGFSRRAARTS